MHFDRLKPYLRTSVVSWLKDNAEAFPKETADVTPTIVNDPFLESVSRARARPKRTVKPPAQTKDCTRDKGILFTDLSLNLFLLIRI